LYHERQRLELCALHALNNVLQRPAFSRRQADAICKRHLAPNSFLNPHRSPLGTGNYDVNVILAALQSLGLTAVWWDKRRPLSRLQLPPVLGLILNLPSRPSWGPLRLPVHRPHWVGLGRHQGTFYNLDSKLPAPIAIGGDAELRVFLEELLARGPCEILLVLSPAAEAARAW
ncbi:JOS2 protein, partial [Rhinopomastus cyanomelas]|nr:JOS2 protein [Rhinopomastus cyanomelas]